MANNKFFKNTYVTGGGRRNYIYGYGLEDPLFTSFTFDIDYITSPLFYTINYKTYGYPSSTLEGIASEIETALKATHATIECSDDGYDILPVYSANFIDKHKLGFGLQQNVYMDQPLYGATEYIYMVDKRNGTGDQNDVMFDSNIFAEGYGNPNAANSYKLGDSINSLVNESDRQWAEERKKQADNQVAECDNILNDKDLQNSHENNRKEMETAESSLSGVSVNVVGEDGQPVDYTEEALLAEIEKYKNIVDAFEIFEKNIMDWVNSELSKQQDSATSLYNNNKCIQQIVKYDDLATCDDTKKQSYYDALKKKFGASFVNDYILGGSGAYMTKFNNNFNSFVTVSGEGKNSYKTEIEDDKKSFLLETKCGDGRANVRSEKIVDKFKDELKTYGLLDDGGALKGSVYVVQMKNLPDWLSKLLAGLVNFTQKCMSIAEEKDNYKKPDKSDSIRDDWATMSKDLMSYQCDMDMSFVDFESETIKKNKEILLKYENALTEIRTKLYGYKDGEVCTKDNPTPDSEYGKYLAAKDKYENDEISQAESAKSVALSGSTEMDSLITEYDGVIVVGNVNQSGGGSDSEDDEPSGGNDDSNNVSTGGGTDNKGSEGGSEGGGTNSKSDGSQNPDATQTGSEQKKQGPPPVAPQTVLDMLGFITGMKRMTNDYPYIIQGITGLDTAYNKHYGIKDPYMGSGDDKITLTCLESLDLRVSSMFNRYFNAVYDRQYRRERVPVNLRRFNCLIYVHDVRNFVARNRDSYNDNDRILELTGMYHSVIEFRFYDCEIVPEETGNIFNDISNEAPSDMKKTNFTFTYGNCVVNFVPSNEVSKY